MKQLEWAMRVVNTAKMAWLQLRKEKNLSIEGQMKRDYLYTSLINFEKETGIILFDEKERQ